MVQLLSAVLLQFDTKQENLTQSRKDRTKPQPRPLRKLHNSSVKNTRVHCQAPGATAYRAQRPCQLVGLLQVVHTRQPKVSNLGGAAVGRRGRHTQQDVAALEVACGNTGSNSSGGLRAVAGVFVHVVERLMRQSAVHGKLHTLRLVSACGSAVAVQAA
jgi:hypothetical protein